MFRRLSLVLLFIVITGIIAPVFNCAQAVGATLFLSPGSGTYNVNKAFTVKVMVNSGGGTGINAAEGTVSFDPALVLVSGLSNTSSIFELWTAKPSFSNTKGSISFGGGSPGAFTGSAGTIFSITFVPKAVGETEVKFSAGTVLAADGKGTNVYSGSGSAKFIFTEATAPKEETPVKPKEEKKKDEAPKGSLPPAPEVSSPTHPEEDKWYSNNKPQFDWKLLADVTGVSYLIDDKATSNLSTNSDGVVESKTFEDVKNGESYFHIKYRNQYGWGPVTNRKILIDVDAPADFKVTVDNGGDLTNPAPYLKFNTTDTVSGLDKFNVVLGDMVDAIAPRDFGADPYKLKVLAPGKYTASVVAMDRAGNSSTSTADFMIEPLRAPVITEIPSIINRGDELIIRGTSFYPQANIEIYIGKGGSEEVTLTFKVRTDEEGNWSYFYKKAIDNGNYEVWAKVIDDRGAVSTNSARKTLTIITPSIIITHGWLIIIILLLIIIILIAIIIYQHYTFVKEKERIMRETVEAKNKMSEVFAALQEEVDELMEFADKKAGLSESEKRVKEKLKEALDISEEFIEKEIDDIEKEIK